MATLSQPERGPGGQPAARCSRGLGSAREAGREAGGGGGTDEAPPGPAWGPAGSSEASRHRVGGLPGSAGRPPHPEPACAHRDWTEHRLGATVIINYQSVMPSLSTCRPTKAPAADTGGQHEVRGHGGRQAGPLTGHLRSSASPGCVARPSGRPGHQDPSHSWRPSRCRGVRPLTWGRPGMGATPRPNEGQPPRQVGPSSRRATRSPPGRGPQKLPAPHVSPLEGRGAQRGRA